MKLQLEFSFPAREGYNPDDIVIEEQVITGRNDLQERIDLTVELKGKGFKYADINGTSVRTLGSEQFPLSIQNISIKSDKTMLVRISIHRQEDI